MTKIQFLQEFIAVILRLTMIPMIVRDVFQRNKVTILLYHKIGASLFERHLNYLLKHYSIISLDEFIQAKNQNNMNVLPTRSIVITFDDGAKVNHTLQDLMQKYNVPATFFVCSDILGTNHHFWFSYEDKIKKNLKTIADNERLRLLSQIGFNETKDYDAAEALSCAEISDLLNVGISIQSHTLSHPILPMCDDSKAEVEISKSKIDLEKKFGIKVDYFSYPNGDYLPRDVDICRRSGYLAAATMDPGFNDIHTDVYKLKRMSICDNASVNQLIVKSSGVWGFYKGLFKLPGYRKFESLFDRGLRTGCQGN